MIEKTGDLFTTDAFYIGHGVNTQGVMGAGIAKMFRDRYRQNYLAYKRDCQNGSLQPGGILSIYENEKVIMNLATQRMPGPDAQYSWLVSAVNLAANKIMTDYFADQPKVLAIPEIGCGIGGLDWEVVEEILLGVEIMNPGFQFEVWHYE